MSKRVCCLAKSINRKSEKARIKEKKLFSPRKVINFRLESTKIYSKQIGYFTINMSINYFLALLLVNTKEPTVNSVHVLSPKRWLWKIENEKHFHDNNASINPLLWNRKCHHFFEKMSSWGPQKTFRTSSAVGRLFSLGNVVCPRSWSLFFRPAVRHLECWR